MRKDVLQASYWKTREGLRKSPYVHPRNPVLRKVAQEVRLEEIGTPAIQARVNRLFATAKGEKGRPQTGLADPQVAKEGKAKRIIVINSNPMEPAKGELLVFINPKIIAASPETTEAAEGCFSVDNQAVGRFERPKSTTVAGYDRQGNQIEATFEEYGARVPPHEIDHLDGKTFVSHIEDPKKQGIWRRRRDMPLITAIGGSANWPIRLTERNLKRLKKGKKAKTVFERALTPPSELKPSVRKLLKSSKP